MARQPEYRERDLVELYARLEARLRAVEARSPFSNSGMHPNGADGVTVDGELRSSGFDGDLAAGDAGSKGWAFNDERAAIGELFLRPGSISNESLTNPVDGKVGNVSATGFALSPGVLTELAFQTIAVPAGFSQALLTAGATVFSYNPNTTGGSNGAGGDAVYCMVQVTTPAGSQASHANPVGVSGSGGYATSFSAAGFNLAGLSGGDAIRLSVYGCSAYAALAANPDNYANAYGSLIFLR
jgi:hypothetical protein